jgi:hypothetical protein
MDLARRVARRFVADTLTKPWLMAVRRGWLTLMKPTIHTFDDVIRTFDKMKGFVENLRDQVLNVRRGPYTSIPSMTHGQALLGAFDKLFEAIKEARSTAGHWKDCYEGKALGDCRKEGEHMLALYRDDFVSASERSKPQRGSHGLVRPAPLTEFLDDVLKILYEDARRIVDHDEKHPTETLDVTRSIFREFSFGRLKVVVLDPKAHGALIERYVPKIDEALAALSHKGFSKLWYGVLFIKSADHEKLTPSEMAAYREAGYATLESRAGTYHSGDDVVKITSPPDRSLVDTIVHEMGHRYWFKFMDGSKRARFEMIVEGDYSRVHALLLNWRRLDSLDIEQFQNMWKKMEAGHALNSVEKLVVRKAFEELGLKAGVPLASAYSESHIAEAFAEAFERYVLERELTRDQVESLRSVLSSKEGDYNPPSHPWLMGTEKES